MRAVVGSSPDAVEAAPQTSAAGSLPDKCSRQLPRQDAVDRQLICRPALQQQAFGPQKHAAAVPGSDVPSLLRAFDHSILGRVPFTSENGRQFSLKSKTGSQRGSTKRPAIGCPSKPTYGGRLGHIA